MSGQARSHHPDSVRPGRRDSLLGLALWTELQLIGHGIPVTKVTFCMGGRFNSLEIMIVHVRGQDLPLVQKHKALTPSRIRGFIEYVVGRLG